MENNHPKSSGHGGKRPGSGRKPGVRSKANRDLQDIAQQYTPEAIDTLVAVMRNTEASDPARVAAANAILDRGHGKPAQTLHATHRVITNPAELGDAELADIASRGRDGTPIASGRTNGSGSVH